VFDGLTIGVIGTGNMGEILIRGLLGSGHVNKEQIVATEPTEERRASIAAAYGIRFLDSNLALAEAADIVVLAVKPQNVDAVLEELAHGSHEGHLFISIAAGVTTDRIAAKLHGQSRVVRVMPNAPALVQTGAAGLCPGKNCREEDLLRARMIFDAVGKTVVLKSEALMDVVTGLSGSGPAFVFLMIESLSDAGVQLGLQRGQANLLAAQTVYGAAKMYLETGRHPSELKDLVATPGGTTFAGLKMLEKGNFRSTVMDAVEAATEKSRELGRRKG
jgi:pyrroline-5-carboxylate reductase